MRVRFMTSLLDHYRATKTITEAECNHIHADSLVKNKLKLIFDIFESLYYL